MPTGGTSRDRDDSQELRDVVDAVRALGERARFLAVNLAVATAKLKQMQVGGTQLNQDLLDLVARVTRVSHEVSESITAMEQGLTLTKPSVPTIWSRWQDVGVPDEKSLERLTNSLNETLDLARHVFRWVREHDPTAGTLPDDVDRPDHSWTEDGGDSHRP